MAGIYLHIPYCNKRCIYCDFYFTTSQKNKYNLIEAMNSELNNRYGYLDNKPIKTIYFGGGTPSLLNKKEISILLNSIYKNFNVKKMRKSHLKQILKI